MALQRRLLAFAFLGWLALIADAEAQPAEWDFSGAQVSPECVAPVVTYFTTTDAKQVEATRLEFSTEAVRWTERAFFSDGTPIFESTTTLAMDAPKSLGGDGSEMHIVGAFVSQMTTQSAGGGLTYELSAEGAEINGADGPLRIDAAQANDERTTKIVPTKDEVRLSLRLRSSPCAATWTWHRDGASSQEVAEQPPLEAQAAMDVSASRDCAASPVSTGRVRPRAGTVEIFDPQSNAWQAIGSGGADLHPCMLVRTGDEARADVLVSDPNGDLHVALSAETLVDAPSIDHTVTVRNGTVYVSRPTVVDPSADAADLFFRLSGVRAAVADPTAWLELLLYRDPESDTAGVLLNRGNLGVDIGGQHLDLGPGEALWSEGKTVEPVRAISADAWRALTQASSAAELDAAVVATWDLPAVATSPPSPHAAEKTASAAAQASGLQQTIETAPPAADTCDRSGDPTGRIERDRDHPDVGFEVFDPVAKGWVPVGPDVALLQPCMKVRTSRGAHPIYVIAAWSESDGIILDEMTEISAPTRDGRISLESGGAFLTFQTPAAEDPTSRPITFAMPTVESAVSVPQAGPVEVYFASVAGTGRDIVMVHRGTVTASTPAGGHITLRSGQIVRTDQGMLEPVRGMAEDVWQKLFDNEVTPDLVALTEDLPIVGEAGKDADPQSDANRLIVEARRAYDRAAGLSGSDRVFALEQAIESLKLIVDRYPATNHAVTLIGGGEVAGISIPMLETTMARPASNSGGQPMPPAEAKAEPRRLALSASLISKPIKTEAGTFRFGVRYATEIRPFVSLYGLDAPHGALVYEVTPGSPAEAADVRPGDMIVRFGTRTIEEPQSFGKIIEETPSSLSADVEVIRIGDGPDDLLDRLQADADQGDVDALTALGELTYNNLGGHVDQAEARRLLREAGEKGGAFAAYRLGQIYILGRGTPVNSAEATRWFTLASERGFVEAESQLGYLYWNGNYWDGSKPVHDDALAVAHFRVAANAQVTSSYFYLGVAYQLGRGVTADPAEAARWYRLSIDKTDEPTAMENLGLLYLSGAGVQRDYAEARRLLERAAAAGDDHANFHLGVIYSQGRGVAVDEKVAITYYRKAAEAGETVAMYNLAALLQHSNGNAALHAAIGWYEKASDAGDGDADYQLAVAYINGTGVARNDIKAGEYLIQSIRRGSKFAINEVKNRSETLPVPVRIYIQTYLKGLGLYNGKVDARFGPATFRAIDALVVFGKR